MTLLWQWAAQWAGQAAHRAVLWCSRARRRAVYLAHLAWVIVRAWMRCTFGPQRPEHHGPTPYRIYVFNEKPDDCGGGYHRELSPEYFDPATWERDAREMTGWTDFRAEVRYTFRGKKYRMVLRPGDPSAFPGAAFYTDSTAPACRLPKGVLSARLQGRLGSGIDADVTGRVMKYQGPRGDFHAGLGLHVRVHDMFPFDDQADNCARFSHLRIMDTTARLHDLPYADNPLVSLRK